jgi:hypothetical protein
MEATNAPSSILPSTSTTISSQNKPSEVRGCWLRSIFTESEESTSQYSPCVICTNMPRHICVQLPPLFRPLTCTSFARVPSSFCSRVAWNRLYLMHANASATTR